MDKKISYQVIKGRKVIFQGDGNSCHKTLKFLANKRPLSEPPMVSSLSPFKSTNALEVGER